jgi:hypothetical protein
MSQRTLGILLSIWAVINLVSAVIVYAMLTAGFSNTFSLYLLTINTISFILSGLAGLYLLRRGG